jgi:hypothetical protein
MSALKEDSKVWIAYPKATSKIVTDLNRESSWNKLTSAGYESSEQVALDHVWVAVNFKRAESNYEVDLHNFSEEVLIVPAIKKSKAVRV